MAEDFNLFGGHEEGSDESGAFASSPIIDALPPPPDNSFDWGVFAGDQHVLPLVFHGTSAAYYETLDRHGIDFAHVPYDPAFIQWIAEVCTERRIQTRNMSRSVLAAFTASTVQLRTVSLTFDWYRALRYAAREPGGETIHALRELLQVCLDERRDLFEADEVDKLRTAADEFAALLIDHRPLVAVVELDLSWLESSTRDFLTDRAKHSQQVQELPFLPPGATIRGFVGRSFSFRGEEIFAPRVPRDAIRELRIVDLDARQVEILKMTMLGVGHKE